MSTSSTNNAKKKRGRPKGSKNKSKKQKEVEASSINLEFENAFGHVVVGNNDEGATNNVEARNNTEEGSDDSLHFGMGNAPPGIDDDLSEEGNATTERDENIGFGSADMYDVAELLELTKMDMNNNVNERNETMDDIVKDLRSGCVSQSSKTLYESANILFLLYIYKMQTNTMHNTWIRTLNTFTFGITNEKQKDRKSKAIIKKLLRKCDENCPPIDFQKYTAKEFMMYLLSLETNKKKRLSSASYAGKRSAFFHLCRSYGHNGNEDFMKQITILFKGLKRRIAKEKQEGEGKIQTGKVAMPFGLYHRLSEYMLKEPGLESIWARAFFLITWNLICRATNTCTIHLHHMEWENDCMCIYFAHMKNDQGGDRKKDPRHIYSNPHDPIICPILGLSIYFATFNLSGTKDSHLFPGQNQYKRFSKYLEKICIKHETEILNDFGIKIEDIGVHSLRKGAASYVSSGSTCAPPQVATNIRAGWSMGIIQDTYLRYEAAGDQYVGRVVCGLPLSSPKFAVLPCQVDCSVEESKKMVATFFPCITGNLLCMGRFFSASILYHYNFLTNTYLSLTLFVVACVSLHQKSQIILRRQS